MACVVSAETQQGDLALDCVLQLVREGAEGRLAPRVPAEMEVEGTQKHKINQAGPFHCRSDAGMEMLQVCSLVTITAMPLYSSKKRILLLIFWPC